MGLVLNLKMSCFSVLYNFTRYIQGSSYGNNLNVPLDTGRKLNAHTFKRYPKRRLNVVCRFSLSLCLEGYWHSSDLAE